MCLYNYSVYKCKWGANMKNILHLLTLMGLLIAISAISACGKMAAPSSYEDSGYPHSYPKR